MTVVLIIPKLQLQTQKLQLLNHQVRSILPVCLLYVYYIVSPGINISVIAAIVTFVLVVIAAVAIVVVLKKR